MALAEAEAERAARTGNVVVRKQQPPSWWKGDDEAEQSTLTFGTRIRAAPPRA